MKLTNKKKLGKTGLSIPPIIFGTSALGNLYAEIAFEVKLKIVKECFNHVASPVVFDSAGKYGAGMALEMLGKCLEQLEIPSEDVIISNKLGWQQVPLTTDEPTFEKGAWKNISHDAVQTISYDGILKCFEQGNLLLGKYKPGLVSVHDPDEYVAQGADNDEKKQLYLNILDAYRALSELKKSGLVSGIGVGAKDWHIIKRLAGDVDLDWVMFANSMTIYRHPPELLTFMKELQKQDIGIVNSAVFNAGFLIGGEYFDYVKIKPDTSENKAIFKWREDFFDVCKRFAIEPYVACVNFGLRPHGVISISLNTSNPKRVKNNVESVVSGVPNEFYKEMKEKGLISNDFEYSEI
ncbi:MAG: aldo/keto reductase [Bacteroidales bacterium]|nr:aldo/keto reductase [Bacteroidales bacterium]